MSQIAALALWKGLCQIVMLFVALPAALLFLGYLAYMIVEILRELRKR